MPYFFLNNVVVECFTELLKERTITKMSKMFCWITKVLLYLMVFENNGKIKFQLSKDAVRPLSKQAVHIHI